MLSRTQSSDLLDRVLRFHLQLDQNGVIVHAGPSLKKVKPHIVGRRLTDLLDPQLRFDKRLWSAPQGSIQRLHFTDPPLVLRGEFIELPYGHLFAATIDAEQMHQVQDLGLQMSDFAASDLTMELTMLRWTRDSQVAETRSALERLKSSQELGESLRTQATTDFLTGLANRFKFMEVVESALAAGEELELMMIDLDRFKSVNDLHGHHAGDEMLRAVGQHLTAIVGEHGLAARLGGDEFGIALVGDTNVAIGDQIAKGIASLNGTVMLADRVQVPIRLSIGRAVCTTELEAGALMRHADIAMYAARRNKVSSVGIFDPAAQQELALRRSITNDVEAAINNGEIKLHYQALVDLKTRQTIGYEALSRWNHPTHGAIAPTLFVEVAEHINLIEQLDHYVIATAVREMSEVVKAGGGDFPQLAVNLSALSLTDEIVSFVTGTLNEHGYPANRFTVEVTETASIMDLDRTTRVLDRLHEAGVIIALDDFGTGFSSLTHLHQLPIGELKVDRSFVKEMVTSRRALEVVRSILHVASSFDLPVVAEGIDSPEQAMLLTNLGCEFAQGFLFARPAPIHLLPIASPSGEVTTDKPRIGTASS